MMTAKPVTNRISTRRGASVCVVLLLCLIAACAGDPEKRRLAFLKSGDSYFAEGQYNEAILEYLNAVQVNPKDATARVKLAEAYLRLGDGTKALAQYVRAADLSPGDTTIQVTTGNLLLASKRFDDARARAELALRADGRNAAAHVLLGNALAGLRDIEGGIAQIEEALVLEPGRGNAYTSLGAMELARGRRDEAESALRKAIAVSPKWIGGHLALANFLWSAGRPADAEAAFRAALGVEPNNALANRAMASFCISTGRMADAEQYLTRVATPAVPSGVLALADYYMAVRRPRDAIETLNKIRGNPRVSAIAEEKLVRALAAAGERPKAYALADAVLKRNPRDAGAQLAKGQLLLDDGRPDEALRYVRAAAESAPKSAQAQFLLGKLYAVRGDIPAAQAAFNQVLVENPRAVAAQIELANLYLASNRADASLSSARDALSTEPRNPNARLALARGLIASNDLSAAELEIEALLKDYPQSAAVHVQSGLLATVRKDPGGARTAFERALHIAPGSLDAIAGLIALDLSSGDFAAAKARADAVLTPTPKPEALVLAAQTHMAARNPVTAERLLRQAIIRDPSRLSAYGLLGQLLLSQRKLEEARREFAALAARQTRPSQALTMLGLISQLQGNMPAAKEHFEKAVAADSHAAVAANNLAWLYAESGEKLDIALQLAQGAVAALPQEAQVSDTLGWVYYKKNLADLAVTTFASTVRLDPKNPVYHYHLGLAYLMAGDVTRGRSALHKALTIDGSFDGANDARRALEESGSQTPR